jgi:hypothetical protein
MKYRKKTHSDTWHYCQNCSGWPTSDYVEKDEKPTSGELCDQCRAKERAGTCEKKY